ncbi:MAG: ABC-F family ATP-binding cassette domain-containing protein [Nocardioides sp.]
MFTSITLSSLTLEWADGTVALDDLSATFSSGRTGLVGDNGAGKSTLLKVIAGLIAPTSGSVSTAGEVGYLPQTLTLSRDATLADLLGITPKLRALEAIVAGGTDAALYDVLGDDWDIEARAAETLASVGLGGSALDRRVGEISGGEAMLVAIAGLQLQACPITLLDEPTNNLDRTARARLRDLVRTWKGTLVVVSHDLALLEETDATAELRAGSLTVFGGPYSAWRSYLDGQQAAALQTLRSADQAVKVEQRQRAEAESKLAGRARNAATARANKVGSKIVMNGRASDAENSAARVRAGLDSRLAAARERAAAAADRVRSEEHVSLLLPDPDVPNSRRLAVLVGSDEREHVIQGPERVVIVGPNGVGKSTLLQRLVTQEVTSRPAEGDLSASGRLETDRFGYLPQRLDGLDEDASAVDAIREAAPEMEQGAIRNQLGRLLLPGDSVFRPVSTLSGGERFRVSLARLLLATPAAQLLILDEPTNNLDVSTVTHLVEALAAYRGGLLVVSHDDDFIRRLEPTRVVALDAGGVLTEVAL